MLGWLGVVASSLPPNVLVFYADDMGVGDLSASNYSTTLVRTPHIDALASAGVRFTHAHSASATCAPSRYSILSGNYPARGPVYWTPQARSSFGHGQLSTAHLFADAGYATALVGKHHMGGGLFQLDGAQTRFHSGPHTHGALPHQMPHRPCAPSPRCTA